MIKLQYTGEYIGPVGMVVPGVRVVNRHEEELRGTIIGTHGPMFLVRMDKGCSGVEFPKYGPGLYHWFRAGDFDVVHSPCPVETNE